jgi:hypothetical protein
LLGLTVFERDPEVIESAAEQRMSYLRTFEGGPFSHKSQTLLDEVAEARVCLLTPDRKLEYDLALTEWLAILVRSLPFQALSAGQWSAATAILAGGVLPPLASNCPRGKECGFVNRSPTSVNLSPGS